MQIMRQALNINTQKFNIPILTANKVLLKARSVIEIKLDISLKIFDSSGRYNNSKFICI